MREIIRKLQRLRNGAAPRALDLFSGCGGISLGLRRAGCDVLAGLDFNRGAMETWYRNLRPDLMGRLSHSPALDITETSPERFFRDLSLDATPEDIDIICGGPPCQAYSRIGKGKLKSLHGDDAVLNDERGGLYEEFLRFVREMRPVAVLAENVPDSVNYGGANIPEQICRRLRRLGYDAIWTLINAAEYGVPQLRKRVFIIATHEAAKVHPPLPRPTHRIIRAPQRIRDLADIHFEKLLDGEHNYYVRAHETSDDLPPAVGVEDALDDLPKIRPLALSKGETLCQDVNTLMRYSRPVPRTDYQRLMRNWPGFATDGWVPGNTIRDNPRDFPIFERMEEGDLYPDAIAIANAIFEERKAAEERRLGRELRRGELAQLRKDTVPPYDVSKFEGKWTKFRRDQPSHTVVAHLQFDTYSHIHYDSEQARAITVREAARLQSFPDGFRFMGSMREAFQQIGNAVPPLVASALGESLVAALRGKVQREPTVRQSTAKAS